MIAVLIEAREAAGLSQRDVAARMKRKPTFAHLVELGERMLAVPELPEYARALDLTSEIVVARMEALARSSKQIPARVDARKRRKRSKG